MKTLEDSEAVSLRDKQLLQEIKQVILGQLPTATVVLYGSIARGVRGPDSDYDILVLMEGPLSYREQDAIRDAMYDLQVSRGVLVSTICRARSQWDDPLMRVSPFHREVERDGVRV